MAARPAREKRIGLARLAADAARHSGAARRRRLHSEAVGVDGADRPICQQDYIEHREGPEDGGLAEP